MNRQQIAIKDFRNQLSLMGDKMTPNLMKTGEEDVNNQLQTMKQEIREKKLLEYQLNSKKGDVNEFLKRKYSDGNFNEAIFDGYDNSENRILNDITFEYHVFFDRRGDPKDANLDRYRDSRPADPWILTKPLVSSVGDRYIYHIPIRKSVNSSGVPIYETDEDEELDYNGKSLSKDGLVYALNDLYDRMQKNLNNIPPMTYKILESFGFISNNKLKLDIKGYLVEKYLNGYLPTKRKEVIEYLNKGFKGDDAAQKVEVAKGDGPKLNISAGDGTVLDEEEKNVAKVKITNPQLEANQFTLNEYIKDLMKDVMKDEIKTDLNNSISNKIIEDINKIQGEVEKKLTGLVNGEDVEGSKEAMKLVVEEYKTEFAAAEKMLEEEKDSVEKLHEKIIKQIDDAKDKNYEIDYSINSTNEGKYKEYILGLIKEEKKKSAMEELKKAARDKLNLYKEVYNNAITLTEGQYGEKDRKDMANTIKKYEKKYAEEKYSNITEKNTTNLKRFDIASKAVANHHADVRSKKVLDEEIAAEQKKLDEEVAAEQKKLDDEQQRIDEEKMKLKEKKNADVTVTITTNRIGKKQKIDGVYGIDDFEIPANFKVEKLKQPTLLTGYKTFKDNAKYILIREYNTKDAKLTLFLVDSVHYKAVDGFPDKAKKSNINAIAHIKLDREFKMNDKDVGGVKIYEHGISY